MNAAKNDFTKEFFQNPKSPFSYLRYYTCIILKVDKIISVSVTYFNSLLQTLQAQIMRNFKEQTKNSSSEMNKINF